MAAHVIHLHTVSAKLILGTYFSQHVFCRCWSVHTTLLWSVMNIHYAGTWVGTRVASWGTRLLEGAGPRLDARPLVEVRTAVALTLRRRAGAGFHTTDAPDFTDTDPPQLPP